MSASDNILAGIAGGLSGVNDLLDKNIDYKWKRKLKQQENEDLMAMYEAKQASEQTNFESQERFRTDERIRAANATPQKMYQAVDRETGKSIGLPTLNQPVPIGKDKVAPPQPGYRWKSDGSQEPIPGSKPDMELQESKSRGEDAKSRSIERANTVINKVDEILPKVDWNSSGMIGNVMKKVGGTDAYDLESDVETIQAILGFKELQEMRDASKTGGALGQVAVRELDLLQSTLASMKTGQSPAQLRKNLGQVRTHFANWLDAMNGKKKRSGASGDFGDSTQAPVIPRNPGNGDNQPTPAQIKKMQELGIN